jgi:ATP-binding cassette subfamily F protein uup
VPLVTLSHVSTAFGHLPLLDDAALQIDAGERIAVIGRNGTGKSTLLKILNNELVPDAGQIWRSPSLRSARLDQDIPLVSSRTVFEVVADGLGRLGDVVKAYHRVAKQVSETATDADLDELGRLQHELEELDGWRAEQRVELIVEKLDLPADTIVDTLSGGWRRRVMLGRALVAQPDLLLLDEPTNHLDIGAIAWLEAFLAEYTGAVVFVTHDRTFLRKLGTRIVELDRGHLTSWPGNYDTFLEKKEAWLANEALQNEKFDKRLAEEEVWLRQGIKARRTRDEGRVRALMAMRNERAARRNRVGNVRMSVDAADRSGHVVFEAENISMSFGDKAVIRNFSTRIIRGDRIGLIGPNGAGKTTLLRMIVGQLRPDSGEVHAGTGLEVAYFDQQREQLDPEKSVVDTVADGNDTVVINGQPRHVHGYLRDFLFPPERAHSPVKALSGGERNRLLLARLLARPANVLVFDEPTNDLDLETLELLEAQLVEFPGTILVVSHDRAFLDNVVTSVLAFEGDGRIEEYVGGYEDWVRQRSENRTMAARQPAPTPAPASLPKAVPASKGETTAARAANTPKLSFKEKKELETLPATIEKLEDQIRTLETRLASPDFYREGAEAVRKAVTHLEKMQADLLQTLTRWEQLESRK